MQRDPRTWDVTEVGRCAALRASPPPCLLPPLPSPLPALTAPWPPQVRYWLDFVGLSQHRYKFSHHAVDGRTLVKLNDEALRRDVGIHSLGQRQQILEYIEVRPAGSDVCGRRVALA